MFECVINISEGRDVAVLDEFSAVAGPSLRDRHRDSFHHRSVFTLINDPDELVAGVHALVRHAYQRLDLRTHAGVHPRFGVVDVVPFVALDWQRKDEARQMRDATANWLAANFDVPVFLYGPLTNGTVRSLPEVRRLAFTSLAPDVGPSSPPPARGAVAVGCRDILVAWNVWLAHVTLDDARAIASDLRRPAVRVLALRVGDDVQISCNLVDVEHARASEVYDEIASRLTGNGVITRAELVGLAPKALLDVEDPTRWSELGLSPDSTIEARIAS